MSFKENVVSLFSCLHLKKSGVLDKYKAILFLKAASLVLTKRGRATIYRAYKHDLNSRSNDEEATDHKPKL